MHSGEISSPPRPSRLSSLTCPAPLTDTHHGLKHIMSDELDLSRDFEGHLLERAVSSIPQVMSEVFSAQKGQADEIHKQKAILASLEENITKERESNTDQEIELRCVSNKSCQTDERAHELRQALKVLASDIQSLVCVKHDLGLAVGRLEDQLQTQHRRFTKYREKTSTFSKKTLEHERRFSTIFIQLKDVIDSEKKLKSQFEALPKMTDENWNRKEKELSCSLASLQSILQNTEDKNNSMEAKIADGVKNQQKIESELQVLQKRNAAQTKRLKTQKKDMEMRLKQKQSQIAKLRDNIQRASDLLQDK